MLKRMNIKANGDSREYVRLEGVNDGNYKDMREEVRAGGSEKGNRGVKSIMK